MESIENRLINNQEPPHNFNINVDLDGYPLVQAHRQEKLDKLNKRYNELVGSLEAEKEKSKAITNLVENFMAHKKAKAVAEKGWWETPVDDLEYEELTKLNESLQDLHKKLWSHINGERARDNNNVVTPLSSSASNAIVYGQRMSNLILTNQDPNASSLTPGFW